MVPWLGGQAGQAAARSPGNGPSLATTGCFGAHCNTPPCHHRGITGLHPSLFHRQCLSHPIITLSKRLQDPNHRSLSLSHNKNLDFSDSQNSSLSMPEMEGDALEEGEENWTDYSSDGTARTSDNDVSTAYASSSRTHHPWLPPVHCDLSLFHHPSHRAGSSPSPPSLRCHPQGPKPTLPLNPQQ